MNPAFWERPDWLGGDNIRSGAQPFWMRDMAAETIVPKARPDKPTPPLMRYGTSCFAGNLIYDVRRDGYIERLGEGRERFWTLHDIEMRRHEP